MASTRFSAGLVSLYPRESDELQLLLAKHHVAHGSAAAVFAFPDKLAADQSLQHDLRDFVSRSRGNPRGPVSRGAMLHLLLTGIGGPEAVDLGPEADGASNQITSFLEQLGGFPEDAFADIEEPGSTDGLASRSNGDHPRSIAASLASQNGKHYSSAPPELPASALQQIALALTRLEENHRGTTAKLDQIDTRLRLMEQHREAVAPSAQDTASFPLTPGVAGIRPDASPLAASPSHIIGPPYSAPKISPAPPIADEPDPSTLPAFLAALPSEPEIPLALVSAPAALSDPNPGTRDQISRHASGSQSMTAMGAEQEHTRILAIPDTRLPSPVPDPLSPAAAPPTREWRAIFAAPPEKPKRRIAVVPVVIACLVLAAVIVAAVILFLRNQGATQPSVSDNAAAAAPSLPETAAAPPSSGSEVYAPRTARPSQNPARGDNAQNTRPETPYGSSGKDRVLGARETYQPRSSTEVFPQPKQPAFVAASTMESRLVYAPAPQHPRIAGLVGLSGMVVMEVLVESDGTVDTVHVLGGHHLLRDAAVNAVRTWRYRPVLQNGRPVPVRTIVRVDFGRKGTDQANN